MTKLSSVEKHPDHDAIRSELLSGMSAAAVSRLHGLGRSAVTRYRTRLMAEESRRPKPVTRDTLLEQAQALYGMVTGLAKQAAQANNATRFLAASKELRGTLTLLGRIIGALNEQPVVQVNNVQVEVVHLEQVVMDALAPYPEQRQAVAAALLADQEPDTEAAKS